MRGRIGWVVFLVSLVGSPSWAEQYILAGEVFGSYNIFAMKQANDDFARFNRDFGGNFDMIESSIAGGLGARFWLTPNWLITASFEPLYGQSTGTLSSTDSTGAPFAVDLRYNVDGSSVQFGAACFLPSSSALRFGLGAGVGYYWVRGEAVTEHQTGSSTLNLEEVATVTGNAPGAHVAGVGEWTVSPGFAVTALAGYRLAKIKDTRFNGVSDNPKTITDYSGFMGRLGLALYLPMR